MKRALLIGVAILLGPAPVLAETETEGARAPQAGLDPDAPPPSIHVVDDVEPKRPLIPPARDLLGSHVLVGAAVSPSWALGKLASRVPASDGLGTGFGARLDAGLGVSRAVTLGVWGSYAAYTDGDRCGDACAGKAFSVGPFFRYHLSQGLRLDPWILLGAGYRQMSFKPESGPRRRFSGLEWLRLELGADYYAFSGLAVGPYGALGLSSYTDRPSGAGEARVNTELSVGLRLLLDVPGR